MFFLGRASVPITGLGGGRAGGRTRGGGIGVPVTVWVNGGGGKIGGYGALGGARGAGRE